MQSQPMRYRIIAWIDGWPLIEKEKIKRIAFDYILVMNEAYQDEIVTDIMKLGIERKRILPCRILDIPYLHGADILGC